MALTNLQHRTYFLGFLSTMILMTPMLVARSFKPNLSTSEAEVLKRIQGPLKYDDPELLKQIRLEYLARPSRLKYDLMRDRDDSEAAVYNMYLVADAIFPRLGGIISKLFGSVRGGFFVEAGAMDGEFLSNTLSLERDLGWSGLLVEADGDTYRLLEGKHRRAWSAHACLAVHPYPHREILVKYSGNGVDLPGASMYARAHGSLSSAQDVSPMRISGEDPGRAVAQYESVQCLPLASLLLAIGVTHVDFLSLDVEGSELDILRSFAWDAITVDVWLVEHVTGPPKKGVRVESQPDSRILGERAFVDFFASKGYYFLPEDAKELKWNYIFVRKDSDVYERLMGENYFRD